MKKQKFNGKLRLKKNVISGFSAQQVRGGGTGEDFLTEAQWCTIDNECPTDPSVCVCYGETENCTWYCPPGLTANEECYSQNDSCDCP